MQRLDRLCTTTVRQKKKRFVFAFFVCLVSRSSRVVQLLYSRACATLLIEIRHMVLNSPTVDLLVQRQHHHVALEGVPTAARIGDLPLFLGEARAVQVRHVFIIQ